MSFICDDCENKIYVDRDARETYCERVVCDDCHEYHLTECPVCEKNRRWSEDRYCQPEHRTTRH